MRGVSRSGLEAGANWHKARRREELPGLGPVSDEVGSSLRQAQTDRGCKPTLRVVRPQWVTKEKAGRSQAQADTVSTNIWNLVTPEFIYEFMKHMHSYMKKSYEFIDYMNSYI